MVLNNPKTLKSEFVTTTLSKIETVINAILEYYDINMKYHIDKRNEVFCEVIKKTKTDLIKSDMFVKIQEVIYTSEKLENDQFEWLSEQIYEYHKDIFLLHYFYAILYSYNYDIQIRSKVSEKHIEGFFIKANEMYTKYKNLKEAKIASAKKII